MILDNRQKMVTRSVRSTQLGPAFSVGTSGLGLLVLRYQSVSSAPTVTLFYFDPRNACCVNLDYMVGMVATAGIVLDVYIVGQKCVYFVGQFHCPGGPWRIRSSPLLSVATPTISLPTPGYCLNRELTIKRLESGHGEESCLLDAKLILCPM